MQFLMQNNFFVNEKNYTLHFDIGGATWDYHRYAEPLVVTKIFCYTAHNWSFDRITLTSNAT